MSGHAGRSWVGWPGAPMALASAALFGASTPVAKLLLGGIDPWLLAGLLYLGAGGGLALMIAVRRRLRLPRGEAPLRRSDLPWLGLVVLTGGVIGPLLLMLGLVRTPASSAALLLNVEGLATMGLAWLAFRENVDRRLLAGAALILAGAALLSWPGGPGGGGWDGFGWGGIAIIGACLAWAVDNNLTRRLSAVDPLQIVMVKGLVAGAVNLVLALALGAQIPGAAAIAGAAATGFLGYGASLVLFVLALRHLGTARTGAYFSTAPFLGAALAVGLLGEPLTTQLAIAAALMAAGVWIHLAERHDHEHVHPELAHEHRHVHDAHHRHPHRPGDPPGEPHTHPHRHAAMTHRHPHYPDLHHRHPHRGPNGRQDAR